MICKSCVGIFFAMRSALLLFCVKELPCNQKLSFQAKGRSRCLRPRAKLGIGPGSHIHFELRGQELVIKPELPMSAYDGMLKGYNLDPADLEIPKEPDREFE